MSTTYEVFYGSERFSDALSEPEDYNPSCDDAYLGPIITAILGSKPRYQDIVQRF